MDVDFMDRTDWERRRKIRLAQVRDQSKILAKTIRDRVNGAVETRQKQCESNRMKMEHNFKSLKLNKLKSDFNYLIQDVGNGYSTASIQPDPSIVQAEKRLINRCKAMSRGAEAEKRLKHAQAEYEMDKEMRERRAHFNKTVEKIRSTLITSLPNNSSNSYTQNICKQNECFLIPSQITLNESNIMDWNPIKKNLKPWSRVINSEKDQLPRYNQFESCDHNKENEKNVSKIGKVETNVKNYETLVTELNKLSTEERNIRNKLFTHNLKEVFEPCENRVHSEKEGNYQKKEMSNVRSVLDKSTNTKSIQTETNEKKFEDLISRSPVYKIPSTSAISNNQQPVKIIVNFEKNMLPNSKIDCIKKRTGEKPLRNVNNMFQRIKKKKKLLTKEISAETKADVKKSKAISQVPIISPIPKRYEAGSDSRKLSPLNYARLPDSFYNNQLETLKEQISKKKSKPNDSKCIKLLNEDLMMYINELLKMTPSDIANLSTSSCSSVQLEESIISQCPKQNTQYYKELLNCISKCLNEDISDVSQDTVFDSPKNIKLLNRLQDLANYYLDKTHKMKNICEEFPQTSNENNPVTEIIPENISLNVSSNSSVDGEYILGHLNTLMQKKGLIKSNKEWPMFENTSDDDDTRSLTDQLLDIYPRASCTCQNQNVQQFIGNKKNETPPLQRPLESINEMLNWIKKRKRLLFEEFYATQVPIGDIQSMNSKSDIFREPLNDNLNSYMGLPDSFYNSTLKVLKEYVRNKKQNTSKSNNNNAWINMELMKYICSLSKMTPNEIGNLSVSSNSSVQLEQNILEITKANLEYHKDILNYISRYWDSNLCDINRDQTLCSPQYIGLLDKLYKLADYYSEKAQEMRNICLESPKIEINNLDVDAVEPTSEIKPGEQNASCSLSSELSVDEAYILNHLSTLLEKRGLICPDKEWPIFGNDDDDDSRSLTDQLLDIKPQIKPNNIKVEHSEKGKLLIL